MRVDKQGSSQKRAKVPTPTKAPPAEAPRAPQKKTRGEGALAAALVRADPSATYAQRALAAAAAHTPPYVPPHQGGAFLISRSVDARPLLPRARAPYLENKNFSYKAAPAALK